MTDELDESIAQNAQSPRKADVDGMTVEQHSLPDQIAADRYLQSKKAARKKRLGISLKKLVPPSSD